MGNKNSKSSVATEFKKDTIIKGIVKTSNFRFALQMKATKLESQRLNDSWKDFITGVKDVFIFNNETKYPQCIKITRANNIVQFSVTTNIQLEEEELSRITDMIKQIEKEIRKYDVSKPSGLTIINSSSSTNLLVEV